MTRRRSHHLARGFTLIEVSLALVLSGMILAGTLSIFVALRNAESTFATRYERTNELDIARTSLSRAMLSLQMKEADTTTVVRAGSEAQAEQEEESERPRLILETDPTVDPDSTGWVPQRLEVVCATPPVPSGLASQASEWYTAQAKEDSLDFSALDGSQGITRGVFELRQSGDREKIMQRLGLFTSNSTRLTEEQLQSVRDPSAAPEWTLWWRPILTYEAEQLSAGYGPLPDTAGTEEEIRERLSGAIPLLRGIDRCMWELYKEDEFITEHTGLEMDDLPAYAQFEVILTNSQYASWMFEVDWVLGDDPLDVATSSGSSGTSTGTDDTGTNGNNTNGGGNGRPGNGNGGTRPGGGGQGPGGNRFDFSDDS